jgi:hypothetical protein
MEVRDKPTGVKMTDTRIEKDFRVTVMSRYIPALLKLSAHKGEQYSGGEQPALINFYEGSDLADDTPQHYLITQATKQWYVLTGWSKDGSVIGARKREVVQRLFDVINYMFLLLFMIEAEGEVELPGGDQ